MKSTTTKTKILSRAVSAPIIYESTKNQNLHIIYRLIRIAMVDNTKTRNSISHVSVIEQRSVINMLDLAYTAVYLKN